MALAGFSPDKSSGGRREGNRKYGGIDENFDVGGKKGKA